MTEKEGLAAEVPFDGPTEVGAEPRAGTANGLPPVADDALPTTRRGESPPTVPPSGNGGDRGGASGERKWPRVVAEWVAFGIAALLIAFVVKTFVFQAFYIPSESMVPTLEVGDRVLVNKVSYRLHDVHRADMVVFQAPQGTRTAEIQDLVKRVVGLPGEAIEGHDGAIYINGTRLDEPYLPNGTQSRRFTCTDQLGCVDGRIPADHYFVLGDNRLQSKDSTYFGAIKRSDLVGRVFVRIWPLGRIGFIGPSYLGPILVVLALGLVVLGAVSLLGGRSRSRASRRSHAARGSRGSRGA